MGRPFSSESAPIQPVPVTEAAPQLQPGNTQLALAFPDFMALLQLSCSDANNNVPLWYSNQRAAHTHTHTLKSRSYRPCESIYLSKSGHMMMPVRHEDGPSPVC